MQKLYSVIIIAQCINYNVTLTACTFYVVKFRYKCTVSACFCDNINFYCLHDCIINTMHMQVMMPHTCKLYNTKS